MMNSTGRALQRVLLLSPAQICTRYALPSLPPVPPATLVFLSNPRVACYSSSAAPQPTSSHQMKENGAVKENSADLPATRKRRRREILKMDESEYEGYAILTRRPPLIDRRGEAQSGYFKAFAPESSNTSDFFSIMHRDWDLRGPSVKRWWASLDVEREIKLQGYNPKRTKVLGSDLAAAHFIVFRKGKVRFRDQDEWVTNYRKDAKSGASDDDLPIMRWELCTLPIKYDPNFRVEAIDCSGVALRYEGLLNFQNLDFVKWLSFKDCPHIDDWCMDRIARCFHETLEYIDVSGCTRLTDKGIGTLHRCKKLKTLKVEDMSHVKSLEIVCALLEDHIPELSVFGVDYEKKIQDMRAEALELERKEKEEFDKLEAETATIEVNNEQRPSTTGPFAPTK